jgi:hypothetical protein
MQWTNAMVCLIRTQTYLLQVVDKHKTFLNVDRIMIIKPFLWKQRWHLGRDNKKNKTRFLGDLWSITPFTKDLRSIFAFIFVNPSNPSKFSLYYFWSGFCRRFYDNYWNMGKSARYCELEWDNIIFLFFKMKTSFQCWTIGIKTFIS